jgi:RNase adapter protein RapZ
VTEAGRSEQEQQIVIMTGPAGSGRSTAIGALEDLGFEAIDNLPISFLPRVLAGGPLQRPVVVGIDPRNREFSTDRLLAALAEIEASTGRAPVLVYLDCDATTLIRRYSETRRRHPLSPQGSALVGIERDLALLAPLRARAAVLIDTRAMTPQELRAEMARQFGEDEPRTGLAVTLQSFSYKRGIPRGADMVMDVRFLRNPHWDAELRPRDGRDPAVRAFVEADPAYGPFTDRLTDLLEFLLPAYRAEGKSYFSLALGCTGGKHRSVVLVEALAKSLAAAGWQVSIRHRDLEPPASNEASGLGVSIA